MAPVKYSSSCPSSTTAPMDIATSHHHQQVAEEAAAGCHQQCQFCEFRNASGAVLTEHMWRQHPLMMRRKKHLLGGAPRKRQISESCAAMEVGESAAERGESPASSLGSSDEECARSMREKCSLHHRYQQRHGEPAPKRSPAVRSDEEEQKLVDRLRTLGRPSTPLISWTGGKGSEGIHRSRSYGSVTSAAAMTSSATGEHGALDLRTHARRNCINQTGNHFETAPSCHQQHRKTTSSPMPVVQQQQQRKPQAFSNRFNFPIQQKQLSNLEALSTVATHILDRQAGGRAQVSKQPLRDALIQHKIQQQQQQQQRRSEDDAPAMCDASLKRLETAVKNINCFDPNAGSTIMPMRIGSRWTQVRAKRIGGAWLVQVPNKSKPIVFVPQSGEQQWHNTHHHQLQSGKDQHQQSPLVKSLFEKTRSSCGGLMKKLLLQKQAGGVDSRA